MKCCANIEVVCYFVMPCSDVVTIPIIPTETETLKMVSTFNRTNYAVDIEVQAGQPIVIPNSLNEYANTSVRFYKADGSLLNDTCYILVAFPTFLPVDQEGNTLNIVSDRYDFTGTPGQTTFSDGDNLKNVDKLVVADPGGDLTESEYSYDPETGVITFLVSIGGVDMTVMYWRRE